MLSCYHLTCNSRVDDTCAEAPYRLGWRLGSTRAGAHQASCHVFVTSLTTGEMLWDSGTVLSAARELTYAGRALERGELAVWFVEVADDAGEAASSAPSVFGCGGQVPGVHMPGPLTIAVLATDAGELASSTDATLGFLEEPIWREHAGVTVDAKDSTHLIIEPHEQTSCAWVQASVLVPQGLLTCRIERDEAGTRLTLTLPPDVCAELLWQGGHFELASGIHRL